MMSRTKATPDFEQFSRASVQVRMIQAALQQRLAGEAIEPMPMSPEQFGRFIQADLARWSKLAGDRRISLED